MNRILCPFHKEETPSCIVYHNGYKCFGCGKAGPLSDLGEKSAEPSIKYVEDLSKSYEYITSLPVKLIRGLQFHCDSTSFYVVWPTGEYYKRRFYDAVRGEGAKYIGASGHSRPLFTTERWYNKGHGRPDVLIVVEGEINALSVKEAFPEINVIGMGGVGDFSSSHVKKYLELYNNYGTIVLIADSDAPGAEAIIRMLGALKFFCPRSDIKYILMESDANEILMESGSDGLKEEIQKKLGRSLESDPK